MRIVSLVPSWTETLLEAARSERHIEVVGRTRFCVHPQPECKDVPVVGGTKDVHWDRVVNLKPDLLLLDQEENPKFMAEASPVPWLATHVTSLESLQDELGRLSCHLQSESFRRWTEELRTLRAEAATGSLTLASTHPFFETLGLLKSAAAQLLPPAYVIWRDPWMVVGPTTFIGSVWQHLGVELSVPTGDEQKYPEVSEEFLKSHFCLFSSEPFPFARHWSHLQKEFSGALVDGESFSWFGIRTLRFLRELSTRP